MSSVKFSTLECIIISFAYSLVFIVAVFGNALVCLVLRHRTSPTLRRICLSRHKNQGSFIVVKTNKQPDPWVDDDKRSSESLRKSKCLDRDVQDRLAERSSIQCDFVTKGLPNRATSPLTNRNLFWASAHHNHRIGNNNCNNTLKCRSLRPTIGQGSKVRANGNYIGNGSITSLFLFNLSLADCLFTLIGIPVQIVATIVYVAWPLGKFMCRAEPYAEAVCVFVSALTHVLIAWDRLFLVFYPFRRRMSYRNAIILVVGIWLLAILIPLPIVIVNTTKLINDTTLCVEDWRPFASTPNSTDQLISMKTNYSIVLLVLQYFLPLFMIIGAYTAISVQIVSSTTVFSFLHPKSRPKLMPSRKRMIKMLIAIAFIYAVSQLPSHIIYLYGTLNADLWTKPWSLRVWIVVMLVRYLATCYNPFIYAWANRRFRSDLCHVAQFICLPCYCICRFSSCCYCCPKAESRQRQLTLAHFESVKKRQVGLVDSQAGSTTNELSQSPPPLVKSTDDDETAPSSSTNTAGGPVCYKFNRSSLATIEWHPASEPNTI